MSVDTEGEALMNEALEYRKRIIKLRDYLKENGQHVIAAMVDALLAQAQPAEKPCEHAHVHTEACWGKIPETEGTGGYLRCGQVSGRPEAQPASAVCECGVQIGNGPHLEIAHIMEAQPVAAASPAGEGSQK